MYYYCILSQHNRVTSMGKDYICIYVKHQGQEQWYCSDQSKSNELSARLIIL